MRLIFFPKLVTHWFNIIFIYLILAMPRACGILVP